MADALATVRAPDPAFGVRWSRLGSGRADESLNTPLLACDVLTVLQAARVMDATQFTSYLESKFAVNSVPTLLSLAGITVSDRGSIVIDLEKNHKFHRSISDAPSPLPPHALRRACALLSSVPGGSSNPSPPITTPLAHSFWGDLEAMLLDLPSAPFVGSGAFLWSEKDATFDAAHIQRLVGKLRALMACTPSAQYGVTVSHIARVALARRFGLRDDMIASLLVYSEEIPDVGTTRCEQVYTLLTSAQRAVYHTDPNVAAAARATLARLVPLQAGIDAFFESDAIPAVGDRAVLFRGVGYEISRKDFLSEKHEVLCYSSGSLSSSAARGFLQPGGSLLLIRHKAARPIYFLSLFFQEMECLVPPTRFRIRDAVPVGYLRMMGIEGQVVLLDSIDDDEGDAATPTPVLGGAASPTSAGGELAALGVPMSEKQPFHKSLAFLLEGVVATFVPVKATADPAHRCPPYVLHEKLLERMDLMPDPAQVVSVMEGGVRVPRIQPNVDLLVSGGGSGKSSLMLMLKANEYQNVREGSEARLMVFVPLPLAGELIATEGFGAFMQKAWDVTPADVAATPPRSVIMLLDSYDEVMPHVRQAIEARGGLVPMIVESMGDTVRHIIVSTRGTAFSADQPLERALGVGVCAAHGHYLCPFGEEELQLFLEKSEAWRMTLDARKDGVSGEHGRHAREAAAVAEVAEQYAGGSDTAAVLNSMLETRQGVLEQFEVEIAASVKPRAVASAKDLYARVKKLSGLTSLMCTPIVASLIIPRLEQAERNAAKAAAEGRLYRLRKGCVFTYAVIGQIETGVAKLLPNLSKSETSALITAGVAALRHAALVLCCRNETDMPLQQLATIVLHYVRGTVTTSLGSLRVNSSRDILALSSPNALGVSMSMISSHHSSVAPHSPLSPHSPLGASPSSANPDPLAIRSSATLADDDDGALQDKKVRALLVAAPLRIGRLDDRDGQVSFTHLSFQEFLAGSALFEDPCLLESNDACSEMLNINAFPAVQEFVRDLYLAHADREAAAAALIAVVESSRAFPLDPAAQSLDELLDDTPAGRQRRASMNAFTLLTALGEPLVDLDLSGVQVAGADVSRCMMVRCNLAGADLRWTRFEGVRMYECDLTGALTDSTDFREEEPARGHVGTVHCVAVEPTAEASAAYYTGGADGTVRRWLVGSGEESACVRLNSPVMSAAYLLEKRRLVVGCADGTIYVLHHVSLEVQQQIAAHAAPITTMSVWGDVTSYVPPLYDGTEFVTGSEDGTVKMWGGREVVCKGTVEVEGGRSVTAVHCMPPVLRDEDSCGCEEAMHAGHASPSAAHADRIVVGDEGGVITIWRRRRPAGFASSPLGRVDSGESGGSGSGAAGSVPWEVVRSAKVADVSVRAVMVTHDGKELFVGTGGDPSACTTKGGWVVLSPSTLDVLVGDDTMCQWGFGFAELPDRARVAIACRDGQVRIVERRSYQMLAKFEGHTESATCVAVLPSLSHIVSASKDETSRVWSIVGVDTQRPREGHIGAVLGIAPTFDDKHLVTVSCDGLVRVFTRDTGECLRVVGQDEDTGSHTAPVTGLCVSSDKFEAVTASVDGTVRIWDVSKVAPARVLSVDGSRMWVVATSADWRTFASGSDDGRVRVFSFSEDTPAVTFEEHTAYVWTIAFGRRRNADGAEVDVLCAGDDNGLLCFWERVGDLTSPVPSEWRRIARMETGRNKVRCATWAPSCDSFCFVYDESEVRRFNVDTLSDAAESELIATVSGGVLCMALSNDCNLAALGRQDGSVLLLNLPEGSQRALFEGHRGSVRSVVFSRDGHMIYSGSFDRTARIWRVPPEGTNGHPRPERIIGFCGREMDALVTSPGVVMPSVLRPFVRDHALHHVYADEESAA